MLATTRRRRELIPVVANVTCRDPRVHLAAGNRTSVLVSLGAHRSKGTSMPHARRTLAALTCTAVLCAGVVATAAPAHPKPRPAANETFHRLATYPVYLNRPAGSAAADPTVAEISAVSEDGRTFIHTDALAGRIGFVDISDPAKPRGLGHARPRADLGGRRARGADVGRRGRRLRARGRRHARRASPRRRACSTSSTWRRTRWSARSTWAVSRTRSRSRPDRAHAAIAIENQRDEEATPAGGEEGRPAAAARRVPAARRPARRGPAAWSTRAVPLHGGRRSPALWTPRRTRSRSTWRSTRPAPRSP